MTDSNGWERWLHIGGSIASLTALGYLLLHLPKRGKRVAVAGLRGLPEFPELRFDVEGDPEEGYAVSALDNVGRKVAFVTTGPCRKGKYSPIEDARIKASWQGQGLYPVLLTKLRDAAKADGCAGIVSEARGRMGTSSTNSWKKFAENEPRVLDDFGDYYFSGLPAHGRIPMKVVKRVLKRLPKNRRSCRGLTPDTLRVGMEIEREHKDITQGRVGQTAKIAAAHICERPDYYVRIKRYVEK